MQNYTNKFNRMINRKIENILFTLLQKYPAINITGSRQSGKTTLVKNLTGNYNYFSLENPDTRLFAENDPRGFLCSAGEKFILDEVRTSFYRNQIIGNLICRPS